MIIDARGARCPWPALRLARALRDGAEQVEVHADDPHAEGELRAVALAQGGRLTVLGRGHFAVENGAIINTLFTA